MPAHAVSLLSANCGRCTPLSFDNLSLRHSLLRTMPRQLKGKRSVTKQLCTDSYASLRAAASPGNVETVVEQAVAVLKRAASDNSVPAAQVFRALWQLENKKLPDESWGDRLGEGAGGRRWRLVFTAGAKHVKEGSKTGKGKGFYFPFTAVQRWEKDKSETENGIYLGQLGALTFKGPYDFQKKKLSFDYTKLSIRVGPKWFPFNFSSSKRGNQGPFFLFFYVDDEIACARGRGGGYAIWQRTREDWELKAGVTL